MNRCIFSFVKVYRKLERNMPELQAMSLGQMNEQPRGLGELGSGGELSQGQQKSLLAAPQLCLDL